MWTNWLRKQTKSRDVETKAGVDTYIKNLLDLLNNKSASGDIISSLPALIVEYADIGDAEKVLGSKGVITQEIMDAYIKREFFTVGDDSFESYSRMFSLGRSIRTSNSERMSSMPLTMTVIRTERKDTKLHIIKIDAVGAYGDSFELTIVKKGNGKYELEGGYEVVSIKDRDGITPSAVIFSGWILSSEIQQESCESNETSAGKTLH